MQSQRSSAAGVRNRRSVSKPAVAVAGVGFLLLLLGAPLVIGAGLTRTAGPRPTLLLVPGSDGTSTCLSYPCAVVRDVGQGEVQLSLTLGRESVEDPQPLTYYTDLLRLTNPTSLEVHVTSVEVTGVSEVRPGDLGMIAVFYCASQTDDPARNCQGSFITGAGTGGIVFSGDDTLQPGAARHIELEGFAGPLAHPGDTISFTVQVDGQ